MVEAKQINFKLQKKQLHDDRQCDAKFNNF